jgi:hypothetical protein
MFSQAVSSVATVRQSYKIKTWLLPELSLELRLQQLVLLGALCCITRLHISRDTNLNNSCGRNRFVRNRGSKSVPSNTYRHSRLSEVHRQSGIRYSMVLQPNGPGQLSRYSDLLRVGGQGIESRWGRDFPHQSRPALGPTQPPIHWVPGLCRGKAAGA